MTELQTHPELNRICLVNMPFASLEAPSIALAQLAAAVQAAHPGEVGVEVLDLHHEFLEFTGGVDVYQLFSSGHARLSGVADWFFRQAAFPAADDNTEAFLDRFYFDTADPEIRAMRQFIVGRRRDLDDFLDHLVDRHRLHEAALVGCTCLFFQTMASFALARRIKRRNPQVVTVVGGAACEHEMGREFARRVDAVDFVFSGPALVSFPQFVARLLRGDRAGCTRIDGVFCRANADPPAGAPDPPVRPLGAEIDINRNLPLDYHGFLDSFERWIPHGRLAPMLLFETSRGCSWGEKVACTFCGLNGMTMNYRALAPDHALAQLRALFAHAPRCRFFLAVDTIVPDAYFEHLFPRLDPPPGTAIMYEVRPLLTPEQLALLCRAGVLVIQPGIEALSTPTLRLMRKGTTAIANLRFLRHCSRLPLRVEWNLLVGSPGEPEETLAAYLELIPRLAHLPPPGGAFPISFDRFSRYFQQPAEHGLDLAPHEFYQFAWPFPHEALDRIAYHFVDRRRDPARLDHWLDLLNTAVARWRQRHHGSDGRPPARLEVLDDAGTPVLLDSRNGTERRLLLTPAAAGLLAFLDLPRRRPEIDARCGPAPAATLLAHLRQLGLLFEEADRIVSLASTC